MTLGTDSEQEFRRIDGLSVENWFNEDRPANSNVSVTIDVSKEIGRRSRCRAFGSSPKSLRPNSKSLKGATRRNAAASCPISPATILSSAMLAH